MPVPGISNSYSGITYYHYVPQLSCCYVKSNLNVLPTTVVRASFTRKLHNISIRHKVLALTREGINQSAIVGRMGLTRATVNRILWRHVATAWWRHQMETFSALLAICAENSPVPGEFPAQRPVTRNFDVFFDLRLNKRLSKQWWGWWFETLSHPLWRHRNGNFDARQVHVDTSKDHTSSRLCFVHKCSGLDSADEEFVWDEGWPESHLQMVPVPWLPCP